MTVHPVLASSTRTQTWEEEEGKKGREASTIRVYGPEKPPVPSIIQSFPPLSAIQVCVPVGVGKVRGKEIWRWSDVFMSSDRP